MTNSVCVIFASFQPEVQSFGALAQSTNSPLVRILPSDFKSLRLRARHAFGTFGEYRTRQKDYDRASASKSDYWVGNPKCSLAFHRARACKRVVWGSAKRIFPGCLARCTVSYVFAQAESVGTRRLGQPANQPAARRKQRFAAPAPALAPVVATTTMVDAEIDRDREPLEATGPNAVGCSRARQRKHAKSCLAQESRHILRCYRKKKLSFG